MEILPRYSCLLAILLSSCSSLSVNDAIVKNKTLPNVLEIQSEELLQVPQPKAPIVVAVYPNSFTDQTGQRKSNSEFALFSTALNQPPNLSLIHI